MNIKTKRSVLGFAIGANIAAAISTLFTGHSSMLITHITLVIVLLTMIGEEKN